METQKLNINSEESKKDNKKEAGKKGKAGQFAAAGAAGVAAGAAGVAAAYAMGEHPVDPVEGDDANATANSDNPQEGEQTAGTGSGSHETDFDVNSIRIDDGHHNNTAHTGHHQEQTFANNEVAPVDDIDVTVEPIEVAEITLGEEDIVVEPVNPEEIEIVMMEYGGPDGWEEFNLDPTGEDTLADIHADGDFDIVDDIV